MPLCAYSADTTLAINGSRPGRRLRANQPLTIAVNSAGTSSSGVSAKRECASAISTNTVAASVSHAARRRRSSGSINTSSVRSPSASAAIIGE